MKNLVLYKTIKNFRSHLELLLEDIKLEREGYTLAFYFDTAYLQRAALGYKDYYDDDVETFKKDKFSETFKKDKFNDDTTLVCSLVSGGFIGQFRLLPPHQNEFLSKINSNFDGTNYERWRDEVHAFVADAKLDLNADEFLSHLQTDNDEDLINRFTEYTETTKIGFNVSHCLLPWDRRLTGWERKKLLVVETEPPDYDSIFLSKNFNNLKNAMGNHRKHDISNFIDATALSILIERTRDFKNSKLVPRFFIPATKYDTFREALKDTGLISELKYTFDKRESTVIRDEEYFFYRSFFRKQSRNGKTAAASEWGEEQMEKLYDETSAIIERFDSIETFEFDDKQLQEIIDGMENYSFLKNVWIEFINSGDLRDILGNLQNIKQQFDEARKTYEDVEFAEQVKEALRRTRENIFDNLDEVKGASILWEDINKKVSELRGKISKSNWDADALFRNRKLFRYSFPDEYHKEIKKYLSLLLSLETEAEPTHKVIGKVVNLYRKAKGLEENENQKPLILITAIFCALELKDKIIKLFEKSKRKTNLHYSLKIALAGAELDSNYYHKGKSLVDELEKLYYKVDTSPAVQCDLAIGLTYLYYYAWLALKRTVERDDIPSTENPKLNQEISRLINNSIVFAERATSLVVGKPLAQRVYVYNQYLFCLVESENAEHNKKMRNFAPRLNGYRDQADIWSYMYYDTLSRYFRWRAMEQPDKKQKEIFMKEALLLSDDAMALAPNDEEIKTFHTKLIDELDLVEIDA